MKFNVIAAAVFLAVPALALGSASAQQVSAEDFAKKAAMSDLFEIQSGELAADRAKHEDVRSFGQQMVDDHTETSEDLKELVADQEIKVELPTRLDQEHQGKLDKLKNSSANFDQTYVSQQVQAHQNAVKLFENYSQNGDNDELKEWAGDTLPALKEHLEEAKALNEDIKAAPAMAADDRKAKKDRTAMNRDEADQAVAASNIKFVTQQKPKDWSAQALIGRTVYNAQEENLGEINNVILDEKGSVVAVTIGVGGFLGIGEKDVGVPFDALKFETEERAAQSTDADDRDEAADDRGSVRSDAEHDNIRIVLNATQEQLERAPKFVWLGEQATDRSDTESTVR